MKPLNSLSEFLQSVFEEEGSKPIDVLAGYIVGELLGDYEHKYTELSEQNETVQRIGDLASDIEISNGNEQQLADMWSELKELAGTLR